jgi:UDP-2-acetamido-3-amino-2,3-dideoxy-glucuronate N-acetyltransferase
VVCWKNAPRMAFLPMRSGGGMASSLARFNNHDAQEFPMTKVLLLGLGRWGVNHLRNLNAMPVELYVAEVDSKRLEPARKLGLPDARLTTNYKDWVSKVDCVVVVTPAQTHFPICKEFLEAVKDVFVEKPITLVSDEAQKLTDLAAKNRRILQVGHIFRFDPASQWLRDAIQAGQFGRVQILRSNFSGFKRPRNDSGVMFADAIHFVDLFNYFMGKMPARAFAVTQDFLGRGMEDASFLSLEYKTDRGVAWATVETNYFLPGKFREVTVIGSELSAVCDYNVAQYKIKTFANRHVKEGNDFKAIEGTLHQVESPPEEPLLAELRAFVDSVQTRKAPRADGAAGVDSVRVLEAALESAKSGRTVELE